MLGSFPSLQARIPAQPLAPGRIREDELSFHSEARLEPSWAGFVSLWLQRERVLPPGSTAGSQDGDGLLAEPRKFRFPVAKGRDTARTRLIPSQQGKAFYGTALSSFSREKSLLGHPKGRRQKWEIPDIFSRASPGNPVEAGSWFLPPAVPNPISASSR